MLAINKVYALLEETHRKGQLFIQISPFDPSLVINIGLHPNAREKFRYTIKNGRLHGLGRLWYDTGQLEREDPFHKGVLHGAQRSWYRNGQIKTEINIMNNQYHGIRREWYPSGQLMLECVYRMNRLEETLTEWHPNALLKERGRYREGLRHGIWQEYDDEGRRAVKQLYVRGMRYTGRAKRLLDSGKIYAKDIIRCQNTALRRILLEEFGLERFLAQMKGEILDRDGEQELVKINWRKDEEPLVLVKVRCPSTSVFYTLRVPPTVKTVREAIAWTFGLEAEVYVLEEES
ncbi:MAG TPA: toxin-antitoxin system YwqK family antitoxin [Candidatus Omnitrophota bacterium]|nr:toxin-antitoxin system YwqK family antitoxin [Candidatus Omnitrophota bacterium]